MKGEKEIIELANLVQEIVKDAEVVDGNKIPTRGDYYVFGELINRLINFLEKIKRENRIRAKLWIKKIKKDPRDEEKRMELL